FRGAGAASWRARRPAEARLLRRAGRVRAAEPVGLLRAGAARSLGERRPERRLPGRRRRGGDSCSGGRAAGPLRRRGRAGRRGGGGGDGGGGGEGAGSGGVGADAARISLGGQAAARARSVRGNDKPLAA